MKLTPEEIDNNWNKLIDLVIEHFDGDRKNKIIVMYEHYKDRMMFAPASGTDYFHCAWPGGYVYHILNVIEGALKLAELWGEQGAFNKDYSKETIVFAAMFHDLGKCGNLEKDFYIPNDSEWHRINQGKMYVENKELHYMTPTDRAIWILNQFGIKMTEVEYLSLRLADGLYEEANTGYLKNYVESRQLKSNLPLIIHQADMLATRLEKEEYMFGEAPNINYPKILDPDVQQEEEEVVETIQEAVGLDKTETKEDQVLQSKHKDLFEELFGDK
jgi:hypothetical protein